VRTTTRVDYKAERCKDYYEHGFCGFGDTCIFIHDRGDYKSGYQMDQEFEKEQRKKEKRIRAKASGATCDDDEDPESDYEIKSNQSDDNIDPKDGLPYVCRICENMFTEPIKTSCGHYFCEPCALHNFAEDSNCFICGKETNGIFNQAEDLAVKSE